MRNSKYLSVALPVPLYQHFDYLAPTLDKPNDVKIGARVRVQFGTRKLIGLIISKPNQSPIPKSKLKQVEEVLDDEAIFDEALLKLLFWAAEYYQQPIGEVVFTALPIVLRKGRYITPTTNTIYELCDIQNFDAQLKRAPKQKQVIELLKNNTEGLSNHELDTLLPGWRNAMNALITKKYVSKNIKPLNETFDLVQTKSEIVLNSEQQVAFETINKQLDEYNCFLIDGVTGSGKTEVYLSLAKSILEKQQQILFVVPEIGLTPQLVKRIEQRLAHKVFLMHSGLNEKQRGYTWLAAKTGAAKIIVGTRSAIFLPLSRPGLFIVDEEHDLSLKQNEGFLYNARDIAVYRAKQLNIPILLGTATPAFETQLNVVRKRYKKLTMAHRANDASFPDIKLIDMRAKNSTDGLSNELITAIEKEIKNNNQVLLFLNRRGYAPTILCKDCAWVAECSRCDARMTLYKNRNKLKCHHCLKEQPLPENCPNCSSENLLYLGEGTQRIETKLCELFPDVAITRIDRDSTSKKNKLKEKLAEIHAGKYQIIIGTQMLSKGHDFPNVTLVGILNVDHGLYSTDFRATERLAQLVVQVSGRAGRSNKKGKVLLQTYLPEHPLLNCLLSQGYAEFSKQALKIREECALPPYTSMLMIRARATRLDMTQNFLQEIKDFMNKDQIQGLSLYGPIPALMERKAGMYQSQLILFAKQRKTLQQILPKWTQAISKKPHAKRVRWSIEVDPLEIN